MEMHTMKEAQQFKEKRFTKIDMIKNEHGMTFLLNFLPGQVMKEHSHPNRQLYLHVLQGSGQLTVDGKAFTVNHGDVIYCDPKEMVGFTNTSEERVTIHGTMTKIAE